jgi:nitroreductase
MDVFEAMINRRSVRKFSDEPVTKEDLEKILEAGRAAASWANFQSWEIIVVRNSDTIERLAATVNKGNPGGKAVAAAPLLLVACGRKERSGYNKERSETVLGDWMMFDVALFLSNVTHAAYALGYGSLHVGLFDHEAVGKLLGVPDDVQVIEFVPIGRSLRGDKPGPSRRPLTEFVHSEKY